MFLFPEASLHQPFYLLREHAHMLWAWLASQVGVVSFGQETAFFDVCLRFLLLMAISVFCSGSLRLQRGPMALLPNSATSTHVLTCVQGY